MADYYNVTTTIGDAEIANAIANNSKLNITHIAFGDGNGSVPTPSKNRTSLVKEVHRQAVTKYERHATIANWIVIETIIPSQKGGFWVREMGVIANGKLISHGSHAPFEKVADSSGVSEYRLKFTLDVRDGEVVEIKLDESLIYASQKWVDENYIRIKDIIDNVTTNDALKALSAAAGKRLEDSKLNKTDNAVSASKLLNKRTVSFSGAATGSFIFDGSANSSTALTLANSGTSAGTYGNNTLIPVLTVNAKGLITVATTQAIRQATTAQTGIVQLNDTLTSTSVNQALTAAQGNKLKNNKIENGGSFFDAFASKVDIYQSDTSQVYKTLKSLPVGKRALVNSSSVSDSPFNGGGFVYVETIQSYLGSSFIQLAFGYKTSDFAIRAWVDNSDAAIWKRMPDYIDVNTLDLEKVGKFNPPANTDIDTLIESGTYMCSGIFINRPSGSGWGNLLVIGPLDSTKMNADTRITQIYITDSAVTRSWERSAKGSSSGTLTWTEWREQAYIDSNITGNAGSATKLATARTVSFSGAATGLFSYNGTANSSCVLSSIDLDVFSYSPIPYSKTVAPSGYLVMMGQIIEQAIYPKLYALYGYRLPDMRGEFIRGFDSGRGIDFGRVILSKQDDAIRNITGSFSGGYGDRSTGAFYKSATGSNQSGEAAAQSVFSFDASRSVPTASENRVKNIAYLYIVKAG